MSESEQGGRDGGDEIPVGQGVEVPIGAAPDPHAEAAEAVQELEIEILNHGSGEAGPQRLALDVLRLIRENAERLGAEAAARVRDALGESGSDYLDPDFWRGLWMVVEYQLNEVRGLVERRLRGDYATDAYGMDSEVVELLRPVAGFLYRSWWRVSASGLEHVPADGAALLVANHAGAVPWDSAMLATAVLEEHPSGRLARTLHDRWMGAVPLLAPALAAVGQVPALPENAERLLADGALVAAFPEGARGAGKLFRDRYRLVEFEAGPLLQAALRAGAPVLPAAVVGAEEIYPAIGNLRRAARLLGLPYLPVTPFFPWLGPLGLIPLPSKWSITVGEPLDTSSADPDDPASVARLAEELRRRVQQLVDDAVAARPDAWSRT